MYEWQDGTSPFTAPLPDCTTNPSGVSRPCALMPFARRKNCMLALGGAATAEKTLRPSKGQQRSTSPRNPSASAASDSDSDGGAGVLPLSRMHRLAPAASPTSRDSMYCTWALFRFSSLLVNVMQVVQKSFLAACCSRRGLMGSP